MKQLATKVAVGFFLIAALCGAGAIRLVGGLDLCPEYTGYEVQALCLGMVATFFGGMGGLMVEFARDLGDE